MGTKTSENNKRLLQILFILSSFGFGFLTKLYHWDILNVFHSKTQSQSINYVKKPEIMLLLKMN